MKREEMAVIVAKACSLSNRQVTPLLVETWYEVLGKRDFAVANRALVKAAQTERFIQPADVVKFIPAAREELLREELAAAQKAGHRAHIAQGKVVIQPRAVTA